MQPATPSWVNADFLAQCLQNELGQKAIQVTNFSASSAAPPGNNYGSVVIRAKVEYKNSEDDPDLHPMSLIIKSEHSEGPMANVLDLIEPMYYNKFLPEARKIGNISFAPKNYSSPNPSVLVLEDLREAGFVLEDRMKQLDFDHCRLYMEAAASFHAISVAVHKRNPQLVESLGKEKLYADGLKTTYFMKKMSTIAIKCLADATEKNDTFKKYSDLIRNTSKNIFEMMKEMHKPSKIINAINQGDPWTANMMFKYGEDGVVSEVRILDFQVLRYASPVTDLVCFLWTSGNAQVRRHKLQELYTIYLNAFNKRLEEYKCKERVSKESFFGEVERLSASALNWAACTLPGLKDPNPDMNVLFEEGDEATENLYSKYYDEQFRNETLPEILRDLELAGVFHNLEKDFKTKNS